MFSIVCKHFATFTDTYSLEVRQLSPEVQPVVNNSLEFIKRYYGLLYAAPQYIYMFVFSEYLMTCWLVDILHHNNNLKLVLVFI